MEANYVIEVFFFCIEEQYWLKTVFLIILLVQLHIFIPKNSNTLILDVTVAHTITCTTPYNRVTTGDLSSLYQSQNLLIINIKMLLGIIS